MCPVSQYLEQLPAHSRCSVRVEYLLGALCHMGFTSLSVSVCGGQDISAKAYELGS